jgi:glycosyltransferase involved in cell wall biosynthesis
VLEAKLWRWMFANADGITACSKSLSAEIHRVFGVPESRIQVAYNGVDTEIFVPLLETDSREANFAGKYIVSVGSFIPRKGHRFLLEAYANFVRTHPDVGLVIVGGDGEVLATLQDWIDVQGLSGCVTLLVDLPPQAVANVVKGASICVQPSLAEPFGMAVIEAGACGILVAASAVGGHVELIEHEKTGLLFPPADTDAIEKILEARFSEVNRFEQIATTFRNQILQRFTWESCTAQYRSVLAKAEAITVAHASRQSISACAESAGLKGNRISLDTACTESHIKPPK